MPGGPSKPSAIKPSIGRIGGDHWGYGRVEYHNDLARGGSLNECGIGRNGLIVSETCPPQLCIVAGIDG